MYCRKLIEINEAVVVEGRYDKIKLSSVLKATIIETKGFGIYKNKPLMQTLRTLAKEVGLVILTDSDDAGFQIRRYLHSSINEGKLIDVYIPELHGKEKRKQKASAAGLLGVEGVSVEVIKEAFSKAGVEFGLKAAPIRPITKLDLYNLGLSGGDNSRELREKLLLSYNLPSKISANTMITALNSMTTFEEIEDRLNKIKSEL